MSARTWATIERLETLRALNRLLADRAARRPYAGDCPDCTARDGQPCDATCLRYAEDPDA